MCSSQLLHLVFCSGNGDLLDYCVTVQCHKNGNLRICEFAPLDFYCIEFNVPGTNFSIKQLRGKNALLQDQTGSNLS